MSNIVWSAEEGWHDGEPVTVTLNSAGRLALADDDETVTCPSCDGVGMVAERRCRECSGAGVVTDLDRCANGCVCTPEEDS